MDAANLTTIDPDIMEGVPVFGGTRVPIKTLFEYLSEDYTLDEFLDCFPTVTKEMAAEVISSTAKASN